MEPIFLLESGQRKPGKIPEIPIEFEGVFAFPLCKIQQNDFCRIKFNIFLLIFKQLSCMIILQNMGHCEKHTNAHTRQVQNKYYERGYYTWQILI